MEVQGLLDQALVQLKADAKAAAVHQIELLFLPAAELGLAKLKEAIPGQVDDSIIDLVGPKLIELVKAELDKLLAQV